jgi:hypothetical protein
VGNRPLARPSRRWEDSKWNVKKDGRMWSGLVVLRTGTSVGYCGHVKNVRVP